MAVTGFLQDLWKKGEDGSGIAVNTLVGIVADANLPVARLLPILSGLSASDNGDIVLYEHGEGWIRGGFANGNQVEFRYDADTGNLVFNWVETHKQKEVEDSFVGEGWKNSVTAQVSNTIKATQHTQAEIAGLPYVTVRTQTGPNSDPAYIAVRILLQDKARVAKNQVRITEGERANPSPYDPNILLSDSNHIIDSGDYAYYSIYFADGFVSDDATWIQDKEPFHLSSNDVEFDFPDVFDAQDWEDSTSALLGSTSSSTPYTQHNNNIRTVAAWGASHAVTATASGFYIPVRIPRVNKSALDHYRLTSTRDSSVKAITDGEHVVDNNDYAFYNIFFPGGAATTVAIQEREDHVFNPRKGTIRLTQLEDTPDSYAGQAGKVLKVKSDATELEFADDENTEYTGGTGVVISNSNVISVSAEHVRGTNHLGTAVQTIVNQNFQTSHSQAVTPTIPWIVPSQGQFNLRTNVNNSLRTLEFQFFAEDFRALPSTTAAAATHTAGNSLDFEIQDGVYLRIFRTPDNVAIYRTSHDASNVDITVRPILTVGLTTYATASIEDATYQDLAADVNLPVPNSSPFVAYEYGAWTEIWRYTATEDDEHWIIGANFELKPDWTFNNGDRGTAQIRVRHLNSANVQQRELLHPSTRYFRNHMALVQDVGFSLTEPADLDTGDYVIIEGRAGRQLAGAGNIVVSGTLSNFWRVPREIGITEASTGQQMAGFIERPRQLTLWKRAAIATTPTANVGYDGAALTSLDGWNFLPITGTSGAGETIYYNDLIIYAAPGTTPGYTTTNNVHPATNVRFSGTPTPTSPSDISSEPPASGIGYINYYIPGSGWGRRWVQFGYASDWSFLDRVSWYPDSASSTASISFPRFDTARYRAFAIVLKQYNAYGTDITDLVNFEFSPMPYIQAAAHGTVTLAHNNGGELWWKRREDKWEAFSDFNLFTGANRADYGFFGASFQFQNATAGTTSVDRLVFSTPQVYQSSRSIRHDLELWVR